MCGCIGAAAAEHATTKGVKRMNGLMTEREWRRLASRPRRGRPDWWGAQYVAPTRKQLLKQDKAFHAFLLLLAFTASVLLPCFAPRAQHSVVYPGVDGVQAAAAPTVRQVQEVTYGWPQGLAATRHTYTRSQLLRGGLLLIDEAHPAPRDLPAPNTVSIAAAGKGKVAVRDLSLKSGRQTIAALAQLFDDLRARGAGGVCVWQGAQSVAQQRVERIDTAYAYAAHMSVQQAVSTVQQRYAAVQPPTEHTVEMRIADAPYGAALDDSEQGRTLLQLAWRRGFVRCDTKGVQAYRFRYVGRAHATAMTYLDLSYEEYLDWLHRRGVIAVHEEGRLRYLILCSPMNGDYAEFSLPHGAEVQVGCDNLGYAIAACTFE